MNYTRTIRVLSQSDLVEAGCFDIGFAIRACEDALLQYEHDTVIFPDKVSVVFNADTQERINCLPAGLLEDGIYGMKWVSVFPENPKLHNLPNLSAVTLLSELETGFPVAFMEGTMCSNLRTAAVSAVAAKHLARRETTTIGFIGAGEQAKTHFLALKHVIPSIKTCRVASRTDASEKAFIAQMSRFYPDVEFVPCGGCYEKAARNAGIIVTAISGQTPILKADWVSAGALYIHVAGLEDEYAVAQKAEKIVCDDWSVVKHRTQTISRMYQAGLLTDESIYADLHEIVSGKKPGRENDREFIYFNAVGLSYIDVMLAGRMYRRACKMNKGRLITMQDQSMFEISPEHVVL